MIDPTQPLAVAEAEKQSNNSLQRPPTSGSWKAGQSGNPAGRPKREWTWKDLLEEAAEEMIEIKNNDGKATRWAFKKVIARKVLSEAAKGNIGAMRELMNRMDGMPNQKVEAKLEGGVNLLIDTKSNGK